MHLIVGATGSLGGTVATRLLERGEAVRAVVRPVSPGRASNRHTDPERLRALGAEIVEADLTRPETLPAALEGVDAVVCTASGTKRPPPDTLAAVDAEGVAALAHSAATAGVGRFVLVSTTGASPDAPPGMLRDKGRGEQALRDSGVPFTVLHPVKYMQDWIGFQLGAQLQGGPRVQLIGDGQKRFSFVDEGDVARLAVAVLGRDDTVGQTVPIAADAATYDELVERIERRLGTPITVEHLAVGATIDTVPPPLSEIITPLLTMLTMMPPDGFTTPEVEERFGVELTSIDRFLSRQFG
jgi:uncharacterized protein YbjT (DUF2867 family)